MATLLIHGNYPERGCMLGGEPSRGTPWWLPLLVLVIIHVLGAVRALSTTGCLVLRHHLGSCGAFVPRSGVTFCRLGPA